MVEATDVAALAAEALKHAGVSNNNQQQEQIPPPQPLPPGWLMKESRSQPNNYYYFHQETGECSWHPPFVPEEEENREPTTQNNTNNKHLESHADANDPHSSSSAFSTSIKQEQQPDIDPTAIKTEGSRKRSSAAKTEEAKPAEKKRRSSATSSSPKEVRVLHILKKHKNSRRPSSWRTNNKPITISRDEAVEELNGLLEILHDEESNPENLIATFKELASQESDCSSAKRHGDLGFFGRKKMRPEFEQAAFGLDINQLSGIVETASGAHILLRLE